MIKLAPQEVFGEYQAGMDYNNSIGLYETVEQNENFYIGKQWEGVNADDLDKPVFNILKRVVSYFLAMIVSDDIGVQVDGYNANGFEQLFRAVETEIENSMEQDGTKKKNRKLLRNAAVDGDMCLHLRFDPDVDTGQYAKGMIASEIVENAYVFFGNRQVSEVQRQPYIIIAMRRMVTEVKQEALDNGVPQNEIDEISADSDSQEINNPQGDSDKCTVLLKYWKENGTIHAVKVTRNATIKAAWDTKYNLYPVAFMSWEDIKNQCHGQAAITGLIPNQIYINKFYAIVMKFFLTMAFPKIAYDRNRFPGGFNNRVGEAVSVSGPPTDALFRVNEGATLPSGVLEFLDNVISTTKDLLGASDAALGNIQPQNTSAIIAVQKSSAMPLELQKLNFYQFVEDCIRIMIDIMQADYGARAVTLPDENGNEVPVNVDFSQLEKVRLNLNVSVGETAYWSELTKVQTLDNLFNKGILSDAATYIELLPDGFVPEKAKLIAGIKERQAQQQQIMAQKMQQAAPDMQTQEEQNGMPVQPQN